MTKIQELVLPKAISKKDIVVKAKTGSGKTLAFSIPVIENLDVKNYKVQTLILAPTRELAHQIAEGLRKLARHIHNVKVLLLCGGVPFKPQVVSLQHGAHIVVGTAGRVLKHIKEKNIELNNVNSFILDEADKMLDMGFYDDIMGITNFIPTNRQTMLFSATYEQNTQLLAKSILKEPLLQEDEDDIEIAINQIFYNVKSSTKATLIAPIISQSRAVSTLIFCNTIIECENLSDKLYELGLDILVINSNMEQKQRDETIVLFSNRSYPILIATDVASRGLHIEDIDLIINYDLAKDDKTHIHRVGRTARAGRGGVAISFYNDFDSEKIEDLRKIYKNIKFDDISNIEDDYSYKIDAPFRTIYIDGGKKQKLRKADILGSLTASIGLDKNDIGKIDIMPFCSYVAVKKEIINKALNGLKNNKIKGKFFRALEV